MYDLMIIGAATRDVNIDFDGTESRQTGGAVTFCVPAAMSAGAKVCAAVKISPEDRDIMDCFRCETVMLPSRCTTVMKNEYFDETRERRRCRCIQQSDTIRADEIPDRACRAYHLAGLLYGDFQEELLAKLKQKGLVSVDAQGFLRRNVEGSLEFADWQEKLAWLPYIDVLKADSAEAEILTGCSDRRDAAKKLHEWGAGEVLISYHKEMLAYDGQCFYTCPVKARNLTGRTGRGDTTVGAYVAKRVLGDDVGSALLYATACVSLKMETPGIFAGTAAYVERYMDEFYKAEKEQKTAGG